MGLYCDSAPSNAHHHLAHLGHTNCQHVVDNQALGYPEKATDVTLDVVVRKQLISPNTVSDLAVNGGAGRD